jgi:hypothetical protein
MHPIAQVLEVLFQKNVKTLRMSLSNLSSLTMTISVHIILYSHQERCWSTDACLSYGQQWINRIGSRHVL